MSVLAFCLAHGVAIDDAATAATAASVADVASSSADAALESGASP